MNVRLGRPFSALLAFFGVLSAAGMTGAVPVAVDLTSLRAIQTYNLVDKADDQTFIYVTGIAKGKEVEPAKMPKEAAWTIGPRKPAVDAKKPLALWAGDLAEGEFAQITFTLFQGKGDDAKLKEFTEKKAAAEKTVAARTGAKLASADEFKKLAADTLAAHRGVITKIKDIYARGKSEDHYGGQFTLLVWNNAGKLVKRLDPVGLTFGEHYGIDAKIYTKIKLTRQNVLVQEGEDLAEKTLEPLNDDENAIRVKMLETEIVKQEPKPLKNVTDYLAEIQIKADGKLVKWKLGGETLGVSDVHTYWLFAE